MRGIPKYIRCDNGPAFVANALRQWLSHVAVARLYIEPGSRCDNGYDESFHSRFRENFLVMEIFDGLSVA